MTAVGEFMYDTRVEHHNPMFVCLFSHMYIAYCETVVHCSPNLSLLRLAAVTARWFLCEGLGKNIQGGGET